MSLEDTPRFDLLLIPGGDINSAHHDSRLLEWLRGRSGHAEIVMAIGSGIDLLAQTGHLDARRAVPNESLFASNFGSDTVNWVENTDWTTDGRYVTCRGPGAAVDMALAVVSRLLGQPLSDQLATHL